MAYIDYTYYKDTFGGSVIPASEFDRLADITSDLIYAMCDVKPAGDMLTRDDFLRACCYQVEFLYEQGGTEAIFGRSDASQSWGSEHLGNYSISAGSGDKTSVKTFNGIPISPMAIMLFEKLGLIARWLYAHRYVRRINGKY